MGTSEESITLHPIGVAHTPYQTPKDAPHQGFAGDEIAEIEVFGEYASGLVDIASVHRVTVVYWAHLADRGTFDGVFTRRSPNRPNPLSICACLVLGLEDRHLQVRGLDAVDGSPILDLKPTLQAER